MPHPLAGKPAPAEILIDVDRLIDAYFTKQPDVEDTEQLVSFGTSGHRGSSLAGSFNEAHILAITQAICEYRQQEGITGPLFLGKDTHALSRPAEHTALEVLAANSVQTIVQRGDGYTPTPLDLAPDPGAQPRTSAWPGRRHRGHARRTTRRPTEASSTTRPTAARPTPTSRPGYKTAPTRFCARATAEIRRIPIETGAQGIHHPPG